MKIKADYLSANIRTSAETISTVEVLAGGVSASPYDQEYREPVLRVDGFDMDWNGTTGKMIREVLKEALED